MMIIIPIVIFILLFGLMRPFRFFHRPFGGMFFRPHGRFFGGPHGGRGMGPGGMGRGPGGMGRH